MKAKTEKIKIQISEALMGKRLDQVVVQTANDTTRGAVVRAIADGSILVSDSHKSGMKKKSSYRVKLGDIVVGIIKPEIKIKPLAQSICLDIIYEDNWILLVNKPAGMVVHPAPGNLCGTLLNALLHHFPTLGSAVSGTPPRGGIVHRLDKDTSGVLVVAKTGRSYDFLQKEFKQRRVKKHYLALAAGTINEAQGRITLPIGRHPTNRKQMAVNTERARHAETIWRVLKYMDGHTLVDVELKTGRTHQIRVHFRALGHPLVGDKVYGFRGKRQICAPRQMLHARTLGFRHPWSGKPVEFSAPVPGDMVEAMNINKSSK